MIYFSLQSSGKTFEYVSIHFFNISVFASDASMELVADVQPIL